MEIKGFNFDRGIDRIIRSAQDQAIGRLPSEGRLPPSEIPSPERLDQLLHMSTLSDVLRDELMPPIADRSLLMPDTFQNTLTEFLSHYDDLKAKYAEHAKVFAEARAVLREERDLRELLDYFKNALLKG